MPGPPGSIPACAGETPPTSTLRTTVPVYPRVCGGNARSQITSKSRGGLSPRVRGKRPGRGDVAGQQRSIPACAGETWPRGAYQIPREVYPRVCGGNLQPLALAGNDEGLSPRVRGKRVISLHPPYFHGSIPACAGETLFQGQTWRIAKVYPRVCGGNFYNSAMDAPQNGLSPRVRGKRF